MKLNNTAKSMTIVAAFALALASTPAAKAAGCSNATLKGTYSDQDTGTIVGVGPFAGVNVDSFNGRGKITISGWSSVNGSVPRIESYLRRWASVRVSVRSFAATNSISGKFIPARTTLRPMRPNPLIPTFMDISPLV